MRRAAVLKVFALLAMALPASLHAQEKELAAFARANRGKFQSEIGNLPRSFVVRVRQSIETWPVKFDQQAGALTSDIPHRVWSLWVYDRCASDGSYVGQNAYGARATVQKMSCDRLEVQDIGDGATLGDLDCTFANELFANRDEGERLAECRRMDRRSMSIPMTPAQYRSLKSSGAWLEVDFEIGRDVPDEVVIEARVASTPTVTAPVQRRTRVLRVMGRFESVRVFTSDGRTQLGEFRRAPPSGQ